MVSPPPDLTEYQLDALVAAGEADDMIDIPARPTDLFHCQFYELSFLGSACLKRQIEDPNAEPDGNDGDGSIHPYCCSGECVQGNRIRLRLAPNQPAPKGRDFGPDEQPREDPPLLAPPRHAEFEPEQSLRRGFLAVAPVIPAPPPRSEVLRESRARVLGERAVRICDELDCGEPVFARGLCAGHLDERRQKGAVEEQPRRRADQRPSYLLEQTGPPRPLEERQAAVRRNAERLLPAETPAPAREQFIAHHVGKVEPTPAPAKPFQPIPPPTTGETMKTKCADSGCSEAVHSRGYCSRHYAQHRYAGDFEGLKAGKSKPQPETKTPRKPRAAAGGGQALAASEGLPDVAQLPDDYLVRCASEIKRRLTALRGALAELSSSEAA
jgi:hypothetical protein